jgi:hypothetical protein
MTPVATPPSNATNIGVEPISVRVAGWSATSAGERTAAWLGEADERLFELLRLRPGWDTYGAPSIDAGHATTAQALLVVLARAIGLPPAVVPTPRRGVQLEWHFADLDFEISVDDDGSRLLVCDKAIDFEGEFGAPGAAEALIHAVTRVGTA